MIVFHDLIVANLQMSSIFSKVFELSGITRIDFEAKSLDKQNHSGFQKLYSLFYNIKDFVVNQQIKGKKKLP
jgi:hypothetical protein